MTKWQVMLGGHWKDYGEEENTILRRAYLSGQKKAAFTLRGNKYSYDFNSMKQHNVESGKDRDIRPPHGVKPPATSKIPPGPTMVIKVPAGAAGKKLMVNHPTAKGTKFAVMVPKNAKPGSEMLVPVPDVEGKAPSGGSGAAKVAAGAVVGAAAAVAGVMLVESGEADGLIDAAADAAADIADAAPGVAEDAVDAAADFGEDAIDWLGDAADDLGEFVMDLF